MLRTSTKGQAMTTLTTRLAEATEPTRELLLEAFNLVHPPRRRSEAEWKALGDATAAMLDAEAWTSAVEMLVPDDWRWQIGRFNVDYLKCHADIAVSGEILLDGRSIGEGIKMRAQGSAKHPALALAIACLKARGL